MKPKHSKTKPRTPAGRTASLRSGTLVRRLRGLRSAQCAIGSFIAEARKACEPYGPRQGRSLSWWRGQFDGLVAAKAMLALADFPDQPDNAAQIEKLLTSNVSDQPRGGQL